MAFGLFVLHRAWAAFGLYHAVCLVSWLVARAPLPELPASLISLRRRHWTGLVAACLGVNAVIYFFAGYLAKLLAPHHLGNVLAALGVGRALADRAALFAYFGIANPIFEELFWRQTVYARFRLGRWNPRWSAIVSGLFFGAWHVMPVFLLLPRSIVAVAVVGVAVTGILFALLYEKLRSLPAVVLLHALGADIPILVALWVDVFSHR